MDVALPAAKEIPAVRGGRSETKTEVTERMKI
jgi:hypothetical protein